MSYIRKSYEQIVYGYSHEIADLQRKGSWSELAQRQLAMTNQANAIIEQINKDIPVTDDQLAFLEAMQFWNWV